MSKFAEYVDRPEKKHRLHRGNGLVIRPALESDLDEVAAIAAERHGDVVEHWRPIVERIHREAQASDRSLFLVAMLSGRIMGYAKAACFVQPEGSPSNTAPEGWYLGGVVVRPADRRRGVGAELTRERLAWIAQRSPTAYYFANARNRVTIAMHRRFGFEELTRDFRFPNVQFTGGVGILFRCSLKSHAVDS